MFITTILEEKSMTQYKLSKMSGVPLTTVKDICSGRVNLRNCKADTLYKLANALNVDVGIMMKSLFEHRDDFDVYKSNICHFLKDKGDLLFIKDILSEGIIEEYFKLKWYPECLYLLAMIDYLSKENNIPLYDKYDYMRNLKLKEIIYPQSILLTNKILNKEISIQPIAEFLKYNIIESDIRNVV